MLTLYQQGRRVLERTQVDFEVRLVQEEIYHRPDQRTVCYILYIQHGYSDRSFSLHWYLAIICNPEYVLQPPPPQPPKASVQTRKRKRDSDALGQETTADIPEPLDFAHDSPTATVEDEKSVENMLGDCNISQTNASAEDLTMQPGGEDIDILGVPSDGELQYPDSDGGVAEIPAESSTEPAGPSRDVSELIEIDDDLQEVDEGHVPMEVDEPGKDTASSAIPCASFYGVPSKTDKDKDKNEVQLSPEVPFYEPSAAASANADVPDMDLDNEEPVGTEFQQDK